MDRKKIKIQNRFLIPKYLLNTAIIKSRSIWYKLTRVKRPFTYFKDKITDIWDGNYTLNYSDYYESLAYFDFEEATDFHNNNNSVTVDLILALVYNNSRTSLESKIELSGMANDILDQGSDVDSQLSFIFDENFTKFDLSGKYLSAIVQGKAASLFIRCYKNINDSSWLKWAKKSLNHSKLSVAQGGIRQDLPLGMHWMEEYPSSKPTMVLNGYLFWLIGLAEYCAISNDLEYLEIFEIELRSAVNWLPFFKVDGGLLYSMYTWDLCNVHYTAIMKYQFDHLYKLTNVSIFSEFAEYCDTYTDWDVFNKLIGLVEV